MRMLLISSGANTSIKDVDRGYLAAFQALGVQVIHYDLERRLNASVLYLRQLWEQYDRKLAEPNYADVIYHASAMTLERALRHDVDVVLVIGGVYFHPDLLVLLERAGRAVVMLLTESPYDDNDQAKILPFLDGAFTNERSSVRVLKNVQPNVEYLPHAYNPERHHPHAGALDAHMPAHDVVFVGSNFPERVQLLRAVHWGEPAGAGIDFGLYGSNWEEADYWLRLHVRGEEIENDAAAALYRRATIGLNLYRNLNLRATPPQPVYAESLNPRAVELAACGAFTISDERAEVAEVFGRWVPTFRQPSELEPLLREYLSPKNAPFRAAARAALPQLVADRTYAAGARQVLAALTRWLPDVE